MATAGGVVAKLMRPSIQRICWLDGIGRGRAPHPAHVAYGSIATETGLWGDVRFTPGSDRTADIPDRQLRARRGHRRPPRPFYIAKFVDFLDNHITVASEVSQPARPSKKAAARAAFFLFFVSKGTTGRDVAGRPDP
jgi:hypothetical protein